MQHNVEINGKQLSLQERALAFDMQHRPASSAVVDFALQPDGKRRHPERAIDAGVLIEQFKSDPIGTLSYGREAVFAISHDNRLSVGERAERSERYLNAYLGLTLKLDREAFPPSKHSEVQQGTPAYLPDGFVDMGSSPEVDPVKRSREMIALDKADLFRRYRNDIRGFFTNDAIVHMSKADRDRRLAAQIARSTYFQLPYNIMAAEEAAGGHIRLSELDQAVCRHLALMYQALCQVTGVESRLLKNDFSEKVNGTWTRPEPHGANMVKLDDGWYLMDPTQPDIETTTQGKIWKPGAFPIDGPPAPGAVQVEYKGTLPHSGREKRYIFRNNCYWQIAKTA